MENLIFLLNKSWSPVAADQFFSIFPFLGDAAVTAADFNPMTDMVFSVLRFFAATVFVAFLAYFATKKMAGARGIGRKKGNLFVVESVNLGGQAVAQLIKAGDKYFLVGVTKEQVTLLAEFEKEQIVEPEMPDFKNMNTPFGKVLSLFTNQSKDPQKGEDEDA